MRGWSVEGVWEAASRNSMVRSAVILGMVVYRCDEVAREKWENESIAEVDFSNRECAVLRRPMMMFVEVVDEKVMIEAL